MASLPTTSDWTISFGDGARVKAGLVAAAFLGVFYPVVLELWYSWTHSADWSHGPMIPLFSAYLLYLSWDRARACAIRGAWLGLPVMLAALLLYQACLWNVLNYAYVKPAAMLLCLLGVVILLCGLPVLRYAFVPWLYLFFAVPLPKGLYFMLTDPLRRMAAVVATNVLMLFPGLDIEQIGSTIEFSYRGQLGHLGVADACSGMRSTITLCALGVAVAFMQARPVWHRVILVAACVPIAVFSNFIRVTVTCILYIFVDPAYAQGNFHTGLGLVTLLIAMAMFLGLAWLLNNLFVAESDDAPRGAVASR